MKSYDIFSFGFRDYKVGWLHQSFTMYNIIHVPLIRYLFISLIAFEVTLWTYQNLLNNLYNRNK
jgi:hypothetical protein